MPLLPRSPWPRAHGLRLLGLALGLAAPTFPAAAEDWSHWAGPRFDFTVDTDRLAESWPEEGPPVLWQRPLGAGTSSVVAVGDRLFTLYREGDTEVVIALDATTGTTAWEYRHRPTLWSDMTHQFGIGPNSTPLVVDDLLIALGISGNLHALDTASGEPRWQLDLTAEHGRRRRVEEYGYSANPLPYGDTVLVLVGGEDAAVIALAKDGSRVWASQPGGISYAQPTLARLAGRDQFLYFEPEGIVALDPATGATLWRHAIEFNNGNHLTPAVPCDDRHVWVSSQFDTGGGRLLEVTAGAGGRLVARELWSTPKLQTSHWPLIRQGDVLYGSIGSNRTSFLAAVDWRSGEVLWRKRGHHKAQALWADGKLLFLDESGDLGLARVTPEGVTILASTPVAKAHAWTLPTLVGTTLYVRDQEKLVALDLASPPEKAPKRPTD